MSLKTEQLNIEVIDHHFVKKTVKRSKPVKYIVVHCSASDWGDAEEIHKWHVARSWSGIGYHYVILNGYTTYQNVQAKKKIEADIGKIQTGRPEELIGAHVKGMNDNSIGICVIGKYDQHAPTDEVLSPLYGLLMELLKSYPDAQIIGHREAYPILGEGIKKTCPGSKFNMDIIREHIEIGVDEITEPIPEPVEEEEEEETDIPDLPPIKGVGSNEGIEDKPEFPNNTTVTRPNFISSIIRWFVEWLT